MNPLVIIAVIVVILLILSFVFKALTGILKTIGYIILIAALVVLILAAAGMI